MTLCGGLGTSRLICGWLQGQLVCKERIQFFFLEGTQGTQGTGGTMTRDGNDGDSDGVVDGDAG
jgi:hypothetical protein